MLVAGSSELAVMGSCLPPASCAFLCALASRLRWHIGTSYLLCRDAADQLAYLYGELEDVKAPLYDVPTAVQVLETGVWQWRGGRPRYAACRRRNTERCEALGLRLKPQAV